MGFSDREFNSEDVREQNGRSLMQVNVLGCSHRRKGKFEMPWSRYCIWDDASSGGSSRCMVKIFCLLIVAE